MLDAACPPELVDPLERPSADNKRPRRRYVLEETGFNEVPVRYRRFYRHWRDADDVLAPNEALCPVCEVVIRSANELRAGDLVYCMPCMSRLVLAEEGGMLIAKVVY